MKTGPAGTNTIFSSHAKCAKHELPRPSANRPTLKELLLSNVQGVVITILWQITWDGSMTAKGRAKNLLIVSKISISANFTCYFVELSSIF